MMLDNLSQIASIGLMLIGQLAFLVAYLAGMKKDVGFIAGKVAELQHRMETVEQRQSEHLAIQYQLKSLGERISNIERGFNG